MSNINQLVDVCIITYNHEQFINECVTSTFNQNTNSKLKVHVCDDASSDQTIHRLKELTPLSKNISLTTNQNHQNIGVSANFHQSIKQAKSEYIAILEGDDYWIDPGKLDIQIKAMEGNPEASFCFTDVWVEKNGKRENIYPNLGDKTRIFSSIDLADQTGSIAQTCTLLIRRKFLQDLPDWVLNSYTLDWCLQIFLANQGPALYIPQTTAVYRIHDQGIWSKLSAFEGWRKNLAFYKTALQQLPDKSSKKRLIKRVKHLIHEALELANIHANKSEIRMWLVQKFINCPFTTMKQTLHSLRLLLV